MDKQKLNDLLKIPIEELVNFKLHVAITDKNDNHRNPLNEFRQGTFKEFQERQIKENFKRHYILSLIRISENNKSEWLFAGIYEVLGYKEINDRYKYQYQTVLTEQYQELIGKLVVDYRRGIQSYCKLETHIDNIHIIKTYK